MHLRTAFTHLILRSFVLHSGFDVAFSVLLLFAFFFQAEDGIRYRSPSRGLGDMYKRQR